MLLENAEGDICIVGDDDLVYLEGYQEKIRRAYLEHPEADVIAFSKQLSELRKDAAGRLGIQMNEALLDLNFANASWA